MAEGDVTASGGNTAAQGADTADTQRATGDRRDPADEVLDLTTLADEAVVGPSLKSLEPGTKPYDPAPAREKVRSVVAIILVLCLVFTVVAAFATAWMHKATGDDLGRLVAGVLTPVVGVVGAVIGFYFGSGDTPRQGPR